MAAPGLSVAPVYNMAYAMLDTAIHNIVKPELNGLLRYLLHDGLLSAEIVKAVSETIKQQDIALTHHLVKSKILSSEAILACCKRHFNLPFFDLKNYNDTHLKQASFKLELIYRYRVIPLHRDENSLYVGITDPTDHTTLTTLSFHTGLPIRPMLVAEEELDKIINMHYARYRLNSHLEATLEKILPIDNQFSLRQVDQTDEPISEFVDRLIAEAIEKKISDVHIEPYETHCRIRFRHDGMLINAATMPPHLAIRIITRLKIMANLNIAERRLPQDGRIQFLQTTHHNKVDIRISICPILFGEKIVLRILDSKKTTLAISALGMNQSQQALFLQQLNKPQGLILVTGPTGSGKTVTLYAALHYLNKIEKNISTVEDPVEIELNGINQININTKIGLDFSTILRALLRQDPDIMMVGEIRDQTTANIALQAAQTGHLVLSTLHTNSALETIVRLESMGIASYNIINAITLIIAQRLLRKLCSHCKIRSTFKIEAKQAFHHYNPNPMGCEHCYQGYQGRVGIFECISITENIAKHILLRSSIAVLEQQVQLENQLFLWEAGLEKVNDGTSNYEELLRVVGK